MKYSEDQARRMLDDRLSTVNTAWTSKRDLWNEIYSLYRFWVGADAEVQRGERSNIFIPLAFAMVETKLPRIIQALLGLDPFFAVEARGSKDIRNAQFMSDVIQYQLTDEINAFFPIMMWWKEAMIYSNSYSYIGWDKEIAQRKRRVPLQYASEVIGYDYRQEKEVVYDGVAFNHLDLFDCYPAPFGTRINGRSFERMPYFIVRSEPTAEYLKQLGEQGVLEMEKVNAILQRFPQGSGDLDKNRTDRMSYNRMSRVITMDKHSPRFEMYTCFEHDWWVAKIEDVVVRNHENPFGDNKIPIVSAVDTPVPHEHLGIGQIEPIIKLQYYANDLENLRLDYLYKSINPGSLVSEESFLDVSKFMNDPDGIHVVKGNPAAAHMLVNRANPNAFASTNEQINIERLMDKVLGQSDISRGQSRGSTDTATEVVSLIEQANFRFDLSVRILKNESLIPMLDMMADRNMMFWPYEKEIKRYTESSEPEFMKVAISDLLGEYRFKIKTNPAHGNKIVYAQNLMKFLQVIGADQGRNPNLVREIAKYLEIQNVDDLFDNPARDATSVIVQAAQEGLLANSQQAALVLSKVLDVLAPQGSANAQAFKGMPATNNAQITQQMAQEVNV